METRKNKYGIKQKYEIPDGRLSDSNSKAIIAIASDCLDEILIEYVSSKEK